MEITDITLLYLFLTVLICCGIVFGFYRFRKRRKIKHQPRKKGGDSVGKLQSLKEECWQQYVALESIRAYKARCAKIVAGDSGIEVANRQLQSILSSDKSVAYKAPRIVGQVCDFIVNMAIANNMLDKNKRIVMPQSSPKLMDKEAFFNNIQVSSAGQTAKYQAVIEHERKELASETADRKFVHLLEALLPSLNILGFISENESNLSEEEIVKKAESYLIESKVIFKQYGY